MTIRSCNKGVLLITNFEMPFMRSNQEYTIRSMDRFKAKSRAILTDWSNHRQTAYTTILIHYNPQPALGKLWPKALLGGTSVQQWGE